MSQSIWHKPPFPTPIPSPLSDGMAYLHIAEPEQQEFRGELYEWERLYYACEATGEEFTTCELADYNLEKIYSQYRTRYGLPAPNELITFRNSLGLSAAVMGKLLGFGPNQWARYEKGEVPSRSNGLLLRLALRDHNAWLSILEAGQAFFANQPHLYSRLLHKASYPLTAQ